MGTITWTNGVSGLFSTAADWSGGVVPGARDTAVISVGGTAPYSVTISAAVRLGGLQIDQTLATVSVHSTLTSQAILLEAGTLALAHGTIQGTVTQTGGTFLTTGGTLNSVTWQGALDPYFQQASRKPPGTLTISKSLTLEGAGGSGPGSATFGGPVVLDGLKTLNNATIGGYGTMTIADSGTLTFGSTLVENLSLSFGTSAQEVLVNDGTIASADGNLVVIADTGSTRGTVTNNGTISGNITVSVASFTNNGLVSAGAGQTIALDAGTITAPGTSGHIELASGNLILGGALNAKTLARFYATQHVSGSGSYGFGVSGTLANKGNTLDIGKGSIFGTLDGSAAGTITGGTVVDHGGEAVLMGGTYVYPNFLNFTLAKLTYKSASPTLTFANNWALTNVMLTGVTTLETSSPDSGFAAELVLAGDTLSGVGTLDVGGQLFMDSTTAGSGGLALNLTSDANQVVLGADQSLAGFAIDAASGYITLEETALSAVSFVFHEPTYPEQVLVQSATGSQTWDSSVTVSVAAASALDLESGTGTLFSDGRISASGTVYVGDSYGSGPGGNLNNAGVITVAANAGLVELPGSTLVNSGTIAVTGGTLFLQAGAFSNSGAVSVTNGTLALSGALNAAQLSSLLGGIGLSGSTLDLQAVLDLQGGTLTAGQHGVPASLLLDGNGTGRLTDGTLLVQSGQNLAVLNDEYVNAAVVNDGTINLTTGDYSDYAYFANAVTGSGAIDLGRDPSIFREVTFDSTVGSGQTINFVGSGAATVNFDSAPSESGFAGTLNGFSVGDSLFLFGDSVSSAVFKGADIVATLNTGKTISFATSSALTGHLTVESGFEILYSSAPGMQDWSAHQSIGDVEGARVESWHVGSGALPHGDMWAGDLLMPSHGR